MLILRSLMEFVNDKKINLFSSDLPDVGLLVLPKA